MDAIQHELIRLQLENDEAQHAIFLKETDIINTTPSHFVCHINHVILTEPVTCSDGMVMERQVMEDWFLLGQDSNPFTKEKLENLVLVPNAALKKEINDWLMERNRKISRDKIRRGRKIGEGSFKNVYEGVDANGKKIAILEAKSTSHPFLAEADTLLRLGILLLVLCFLLN